MPRKPRVTQAGFHHIINRGVAREKVFLDKKDKDYFMDIVDEISISYDFTLHSYILMDNHYHFIIENKRENLSDGMRQINSKYAQYFNKRYNRVGHLWQDRYKSYYITSEIYLYSLFKYIEYNPIKANLVEDVGVYYRSFEYDVKNNQLPRCSLSSLVSNTTNTKNQPLPLIFS